MELKEPIQFEWDQGNNIKSLKKHGISPQRAEQVFSYSLKKIFKDKIHSTESEVRYILIGKDYDDEYMFIVFTIRKNKIRIISARKMHRKEVKKYEKII